jgi:hypothetical protein
MEQYSKHENTCDIFMNEIRMEDEPLEEPEKMQVSKQKETKIQKKKNMKEKLKKLHAQKQFWKPIF